VGRCAGDVPGLENTDDGDDRFHGRSGPFPIRQRSYGELTPSVRAFIDAAEQQGYRRIDDPNGDWQDGVATVPLNVVAGVRHNTGIAYLTDDVRRRPNLTIHGRTEVDRVLFSGRNATGSARPMDSCTTAGRSSCRRVPTAARRFCFGPGSAPRATWPTGNRGRGRPPGRATPPGPASLHQRLLSRG